MQEDYNSSHTGQQIDNAVDNVITANSNGGIQSKNIVDSGGYFPTDTVEGALQALGAAKLNPTTKTSAMTQAVGKDSDGRLWTEPTGGGGEAVQEIFDVTYNTTPFADMYAAYQAGKLCRLIRSGETYFMTQCGVNSAIFKYDGNGTISKMVTCSSDDVWQSANQNVQLTTSKVTEITAASTDAQYPSAKAVYDLVQSGGGGDSAAYTVDLVAYGITAMESHAAPFTAEEYEVANNNVLGFNRAFADAYAAGYRSVVVPVGNYPVLYQNSDSDRFNSGHYYSIKLQNDTDYNFSYCQMWVMFDSDNPNPYYMYSDENYYKAGGKVIGLVGNKNVEIRNLTVTGDRELRSYANTSEKNLENTTGILSVCDNDGITIRNVVCESFMADGFAGGTAYGSTSAFAYQGYTMTQGYVNLTNGVVTANATPNNVYSELIDVSVLAGSYANIWSGLGYQYVLDAHPSMFVLFYNEEEAYIGNEMTFQSHNFYVPQNAKYIRVVFTNVFNIPSTNQSFRITSPSSQNFLLENVILRNNCRGGASNVPNFCTFRKCKFYHNGKTSYGGAPQFSDSTRYAMDIEDIQSAGVVIDDCDEYDNGNGGFFLGGIDVTISNSRLTEVLLYRGVCYHITNSLIRGLRATSNDLDSTNYFVEASNCTIVSDGAGIDVNRMSNCDIVFNGSGQIGGKSNDNRIYVNHLQNSDKLFTAGDLMFTGFIKGLNGAKGKVIGVKGFSKFTGSTSQVTQVTNCECEFDGSAIYVLKDQLYENCTIKNFYTSWRNDTDGITVTFRNCDVVDIASTIGQHHYTGAFKTVFENCTFTAAPTANNFYITSVRSFDEDVMEFVNCKFINKTEYTVYASRDSGYYKAPTFKSCTFENVTPYPSYTGELDGAEDVDAMPSDAPVVKSVNFATPDENGNVNISASGGGGFEVVYHLVLQEDVASVSFDLDYPCKEVIVYLDRFRVVQKLDYPFIAVTDSEDRVLHDGNMNAFEDENNGFYYVHSIVLDGGYLSDYRFGQWYAESGKGRTVMKKHNSMDGAIHGLKLEMFNQVAKAGGEIIVLGVKA